MANISGKVANLLCGGLDTIGETLENYKYGVQAPFFLYLISRFVAAIILTLFVVVAGLVAIGIMAVVSTAASIHFILKKFYTSARRDWLSYRNDK